MSKKAKILLTCDDGIHSNGLLQLYYELSKVANVTIITSHIQRSAEGKAITINQILRTEKVIINGDIEGYSINGTSADAIILGLHELDGPFDLVVSGINQGLNISSHIVLTSGTCAAAFEASFYGVPAIAFSMDVSPQHYFVTPSRETFEQTAKISAKIVSILLKKKYPENLAFINVNYPYSITEKTPIKITNLAKRFLVFKPELRKDPRNNDYYFLWGEPEKVATSGSDIEAFIQGAISLSPVINDLSYSISKEPLTFLEEILRELKK
ncbi:MAG: 5'/3'-nucleotidase SurE [Candidatus Heimdallarchaeota archaeon]|nr:5'/3'-nucleotidase SurE [Candidatus Heimdallarchaeota archaeon]